MNNTDKLLRAFIEASGYEIEEITTRKILVSAEPPTRDEFINGSTVIETIDYKVTKRHAPVLVPILIQSDEWGCIVEFVSSHADDIETGTNDYGTLTPIWDFMKGVS